MQRPASSGRGRIVRGAAPSHELSMEAATGGWAHLGALLVDDREDVRLLAHPDLRCTPCSNVSVQPTRKREPGATPIRRSAARVRCMPERAATRTWMPSDWMVLRFASDLSAR